MILPAIRPWIQAAIFLALFLALPACAAAPAATAASLPVTPACSQPGTLGGESLPVTTQGFEVSFRYYLPPCYAEQTATRFPVLYLLAVPFEGRLSLTEQTPMSLAERLIRDGKLPPVIIIVPEATIGAGYHAALALDLVPYVDSRFRTLAAPRARGVGGISHGAAIAARMAFEFPETFGSLALFSGGIDRSEIERFDGWIARTPAAHWPRTLVMVGEQDDIWPLTANFLSVLDRHRVPYRLERGQGGHDWAFWSAKMEPTLLWFAQDW